MRMVDPSLVLSRLDGFDGKGPQKGAEPRNWAARLVTQGIFIKRGQRQFITLNEAFSAKLIVRLIRIGC